MIDICTVSYYYKIKERGDTALGRVSGKNLKETGQINMSKKINTITISEEFSLMYPAGKKPAYRKLNDEACNDLSLEYIIDYISENDREKKLITGMMRELEYDPEVISYRCDIFEDIIKFPSLREKIKDMLDQLEYLKSFEKPYKDDSAAAVWQLVNRLQELDAYVSCIEGINQALSDCPVKSGGLVQMKEYVSSVYNENGFSVLREDINSLLTETSKIQSITLGVNLDSALRPVEVGILSINPEKFDHSGILDNFLGFCSKFIDIIGASGIGGAGGGMTKIHSSGSTAEEDPLMKNLTRTVSNMLGTTIRQLKTKLSRYVNISGYKLTRFIPEMLFYIRWSEFCTRIMEQGLPMSRPEILDPEKRELSAKGIYNIKLAIQRLEGKDTDIVRNDFEFNNEHGIYIMTGPNRGGKTTFTQAVGMLFLLAQNGIFVPAEALSISPCDNIYTHFPADENLTVNLGRLGEESKRLSEIFMVATNKSVLLFNEPLATTSFTEGLYIAKDVVRALRYRGARTVFNTHMHELAMNLEAMNSFPGDIGVASLITGIHEGRRSYKVFIAPPEGVSYAKDIAKKYGVTFDQLRLSVDRAAG